MIKLTARQEQILALIRNAIETTGFPPTRAEIASELGFRSANAAEEHLQALARKGAIEISPGTSRGIRLLDKPADSSRHRRSVPQLSLPHPSLMQLSLPLIGRVAAGSPILAEEHISATYHVDPSLFSAQPDYLLKVRGMSMRDAGIFDGDLLADRWRIELSERLLRAFHLPVTVPSGGGFTADALLGTMARDKKTIGGRLRFVLPTRIGHVELVDGIDPAMVRAILGC